MSHVTKLAAAFWSLTIVAAGNAMIDGAHAAEAVRPAAWTALSISSDGVWGTAVGVTEAGVKLAAVAACKARHTRADDCASHVSAANGEWHQAYACGDRHFAVSGLGRSGVEMVAAYEEAEIRIISAAEVAPCRLLVTVLPNGSIEVSEGT